MRSSLRAAAALRESPRRPDVRHRRDDRRAEHRPRLRRRRRLSEAAAHLAPACWARRSSATRPRAITASARILKGQNWDPKLRSPLTEIGVNVKRGRLHPGRRRPADQRDEEHLRGAGRYGRQAGHAARQLRAARPTAATRPWSCRPPTSARCITSNWVQGNIDRVSKATGGKVAYLHIPDMGPEGHQRVHQATTSRRRTRKALIVDVRGNGGGNVSPQITEYLRREPAMITIARNTQPERRSDGQILGPKVMLLNEFSASDGDIVAYRFQKHKLGPVIGKRSWGGVVGIRNSLPLVDGGYAEPARVLPLRPGRQAVDHRGPRGRSRHRRRQRSGPRVRRHRRPVGAGDRGHQQGLARPPGPPAAAAAVAGQGESGLQAATVGRDDSEVGIWRRVHGRDDWLRLCPSRGIAHAARRRRRLD